MADRATRSSLSRAAPWVRNMRAPRAQASEWKAGVVTYEAPDWPRR